MGIRDLPVVVSLVEPADGSNIVTTYVSELQKVLLPMELEVFVHRWHPLYELQSRMPAPKAPKNPKRVRMSLNAQARVLAERMNYHTAMNCINTSRGGKCGHATSYSCEGMNIALPAILLRCSMMAAKYKVSPDLILIQMFGGVQALEEGSP